MAAVGADVGVAVGATLDRRSATVGVRVGAETFTEGGGTSIAICDAPRITAGLGATAGGRLLEAGRRPGKEMVLDRVRTRSSSEPGVPGLTAAASVASRAGDDVPLGRGGRTERAVGVDDVTVESVVLPAGEEIGDGVAPDTTKR